MIALRFETESDVLGSDIDCSWDSIIQGIERYVAYWPAAARDLHQWADLLEGIGRMRDEA